MRAEVRDALEFLYADSTVSPSPVVQNRIDVCRAGTAAVHILLNGVRRSASLRCSVSVPGTVFGEPEWFRLLAVPVEANTGLASFIEVEGERNPYVARRAPFSVFDVLAPLKAGKEQTSSVMALRLHLPVRRHCKPGLYTCRIEVRCGSETAVFGLEVRVHPPRVPPVGKCSFPYTNWFNLDYMASRHGLKMWSEGHWQMMRRYARLMVHARQNTFWCPLHYIFRASRGTPLLDRDRLKRIVRIFTGEGMYFIEGGHLAHRHLHDWNASFFDIGVTATPATSAEGNEVLARVCAQIRGEMHANGWQQRWLQHIADEPTGVNASDYRVLAGMVRKYLPGVPILDATMDTSLVGAVDIWCPQAQEFQKNRQFFERQRLVGDRVWFYTCCAPGGQWLNRLLDMELLRPALLGWGASLFGLDGFLHWGLNHYKEQQDPFRQSVVRHSGTNFLPAGDTHIVYPGDGQPWSSVRLEAQREGFEDFELLRELRARNVSAWRSIVGSVLKGFDRYTTSVERFRAARRRLYAALGG